MEKISQLEDQRKKQKGRKQFKGVHMARFGEGHIISLTRQLIRGENL